MTRNFQTSDAFEQNAYLGIPLCLVVLACLVEGRRRAMTKVIGLMLAVTVVLSFGRFLVVDGRRTVEMPFDVLLHLPLFDLSLPARLGLFVSLGGALATALWIAGAGRPPARVGRWLVGLVIVVTLFPNPGGLRSFGASVVATGRINTFDQPAFFTRHLYRRYLRPNEEVLALPFSLMGDDMLWQADADLSFRLFDGYFGSVPPYDETPLVSALLGDRSPPVRLAERQLPGLVTDHRIGAVLIADGDAGPWPEILAHDGWRAQANVGGIQVYRPGRAPDQG